MSLLSFTIFRARPSSCRSKDLSKDAWTLQTWPSGILSTPLLLLYICWTSCMSRPRSPTALEANLNPLRHTTKKEKRLFGVHLAIGTCGMSKHSLRPACAGAEGKGLTAKTSTRNKYHLFIKNNKNYAFPFALHLSPGASARHIARHHGHVGPPVSQTLHQHRPETAGSANICLFMN